MNRRLLAFYALVVVSIVGLTVFVHVYPISNFDLKMTQEIQEQRSWDLTLLMRCISIFGNTVVAFLSIIIASLLFLLTSRRREACFTLAAILPNLCNIVIKILDIARGQHWKMPRYY